MYSCSEDGVPVDRLKSQPFSVVVGLRQWYVLVAEQLHCLLHLKELKITKTELKQQLKDC